MMCQYIYAILKFLRKIYVRLFYKSNRISFSEQDLDRSQQIIFNLLSSGKPCMIARFGSIELDNVVNYLGRMSSKRKLLSFILNKQPAWWLELDRIEALSTNAGFFPKRQVDLVDRFCKMTIDSASDLDVLGSWQDNEKYLKERLQSCQLVELANLEPFFAERPWTRYLEGKKVLVVHPFAETIKKQYAKRELLFKNKFVLPKFLDLQVVKAVQSMGGQCSQFKTWFDALDYMKSEIDKCDYDVCLIGCGAYGFPLAAHVKHKGKQAIHLGGTLQLLFGIRGNRWFDPNGFLYPKFKDLLNENWVKPLETEKPIVANQIEGGCYW